jgi:CzcA family heavy metal efflux pump
MRSIISLSLRFRLLVVALAAATVLVGIVELRGMPVNPLPEFAPPTVEVQTEALGLSAAEVEQLITVPMEQDMLVGVPFLDDIRSESVPGLSRIRLIFEPGTNLFRARQVVAERMTQAHALPHVSKPPQILQPLSSTNRLMMIGVSSRTVSPIEMSVLARWTIAPRLMGVPGVANVAIWGQRDRQLQVQVDPERLRARGVSLVQILETAGNALWVSPLTFVQASTPGTGGFIDTPNQRLGVQHLLPIQTPADLAKVRIEKTGARKLRLGDVAEVVEDHQPLIGDALLRDGQGLLLVVEKFPDANTLEVTRAVERTIDALRPGLAGLEFDTTVYRPASFVEESIDHLTLGLVVGAALLVLVFGAFFFRWRTAMIALAVVPVSLLAAALVLFALGETLNAMVLAGLMAALLLVIDDAVADVESIGRRLRDRREKRTAVSTATSILEASLEVRSAAVYGTLIVALSVVPVFFLEGVAGAFFPSIAVAYLLALAASMVVALTVTPALSLLLLSGGRPQRGDSPAFRRLRRGYEHLLERILHRPRPVYLAAGAIVVAAAVAVPFLGQSLLPTLKETELLIQWDGPAGTSLPEMNRITTLASRELRSIEGVRDVGAHVGRAVTADQAVGVNAAEIWVSIDRGADYEATLARVKRVVGAYPGLSRELQTFSNQRVREELAGADEDIVVRIYGEDLKVLGRKAGDVERVLSGIGGVVDEHVKHQAEEPTLEIEPRLAAAQRYGIKPGDIRRAAATLLSGIAVGSLFEQQKVFDVVVWGTPENRSSPTDVRRLLIDTPSGGHVRLADVADVRVAPNPAIIQREGVSRYVDVAANVRGRDVGGAVADVKRGLGEIDFPLEYHPVVLTAEGQPWGRLLAIGLAVAVGIFLLFQAAFGSWRLATISFLTLPLAAAGGLIAALVDGGRLSFGSLIGLLALVGLAARSHLLLVTQYRQQATEDDAFGPELVSRGAREAFSRTFVTSVAAALVLLPFVIAGPIAGYEIVHPLAVVLLGGLVASTLLTLFVVPPLHLRFGATPDRERTTDRGGKEVGRWRYP